MFQRINLHHELRREKERMLLAQENLLQQSRKVLEQAEDQDRRLKERILTSSYSESELNTYNLEEENIFTADTIRNICTVYRLRFLETKYLRYPLPYEAFIRIKEFEKQQQAEIKQFSIMAPAEAFRLDKKTDPLLFAHLGNNKYYLLYRWGTELSWHRKLLMLPLRNLYALFATIIMISFVLAFFIPKQWIVYDESFYPLMYNFRLFLFFLLSTGSFALTFYIGITRNKTFSEDGWNSKWI